LCDQLVAGVDLAQVVILTAGWAKGPAYF
jgi:hypothetical protein